jgi:hypothetical protein
MIKNFCSKQRQAGRISDLVILRFAYRAAPKEITKSKNIQISNF